MLYQGYVRMLGTPDEFKSSADPIIDQFINGRAEGPIE
jgi:phospholipid/cholesterol/gamma-HCH transport system ATP-binding protein